MTKKAFFRSFFVLVEAGLVGFASCTNEDESVKNGVPVGGGKATWTFEVGADDGNRTQLDANNKVVFKKGDSISVFNNADASENAKFVANKDEDFPSSGGTAETAKFNGEANIGAQNFWILYPYQDGATCASGTITATIPTEQTATPNSFDPKANLSVAKTEAHPWDVPKFYLKNAVGLLKFTVSDTYDKVVIFGAGGEKIAGEVKITVTGDDPTVADGTAAKMSDSIVVTGEIKPGSNYYVAVVPQTFSDGVTFKFYSGSTLKGRVRIWSPKQTFNITRSKILNVGTARPNVVPAGFVDLGLIQGNDETSPGKPLYFADRNIGAADETKSGYYFCWGATEPLHTTTTCQWEGGNTGKIVDEGWSTWEAISSAEKTKYSYVGTGTISGGYIWNNTPYQTANNPGDGAPQFRKYTISGKGYLTPGCTADNKTVLDPEDDAASHANSSWRMPTTEEYLNLCQHTNLGTSSPNPAWTSISGENGAKVISKFRGYDSADNYIFFPASGNFSNATFYYGKPQGSYWSSSLNSSSPYYGFNLHFSSDLVQPQNTYFRRFGRCVRAVYKN